MPGNKLAIFPNEIHKIIYDHLDYPETLFLSITCRHLFILAQPRLYVLAGEILRDEQSAGDRFVCVGECTNTIPTTLLPWGYDVHECEDGALEDEEADTASDKATPEIVNFELYECVAKYFTSRGPNVFLQGTEDFPQKLQKIYSKEMDAVFYEQPRERYRRLRSQSDFGSGIYKLDMVLEHPASDEADRWMPSQLFKQMHNQYLHLPTSRCILRNLTTREYVIDNGLGFTCVLYAQISYSNDDATNMKDLDFEGEELHQGPWAGHRFEITSMSDVEEDRKNGITWNDVTLRIRKKLKGIYDAALGEGKYTLDQTTDDSVPRQDSLEDVWALM
jgi:hypothetical protein